MMMEFCDSCQNETPPGQKYCNACLKKTERKEKEMTVSDQIWLEYDFLMNYAKRYIKDDGNRHDAVMAVIEKAIENADKFVTGTRLKCWLCVILYRQFISEKRKLHHKRTYYPDKMPDYKYCYNAAESDLSMDEIRKAASMIGDEFQKSVLMRYIDSDKIKEIAKELLPELEAAKAESRIRKVVRENKKKIKKYFDE